MRSMENWQGEFTNPNGNKWVETLLSTSSSHYGFSCYPAFTGINRAKAR